MFAALFLELIFVIYIQNIASAVEIVKDFIAIQIIACLDDFTGQMILSTIHTYKDVNFSLEKFVEEIKKDETSLSNMQPSF